MLPYKPGDSLAVFSGRIGITLIRVLNIWTPTCNLEREKIEIRVITAAMVV